MLASDFLGDLGLVVGFSSVLKQLGGIVTADKVITGRFSQGRKRRSAPRFMTSSDILFESQRLLPVVTSGLFG
jgi:hypothetical protein